MNKRFIVSLLYVVCAIIVCAVIMGGCSSSEEQSGSLNSNGDITGADSSMMLETTATETPMKAKDKNAVVVRSYGARDRLSFMVDEENRLWLWGALYYKELGITECSKPRVIMEDVADARVGFEEIVILKTDGSVLYWDERHDIISITHEEREFAPENIYEGAAKVRMDTSIPYIITPDGTLMYYYNNELTEVMGNVEDISEGTSNELIITRDGELYVMGCNDDGQLGLGSADNNVYREPIYITSGVKRIAAGGSTSYFITEDGILYGCGINNQFQITENECKYVPEFVEIMDNVRDISATGGVLLILSEDGCLYTRGFNDTCVDESIVGSDWAQAQNTKIASGVKSMCAAAGYGMMMKDDGKLYSWGRNDFGNLGCGDEEYYAEPTEIKFRAK